MSRPPRRRCNPRGRCPSWTAQRERAKSSPSRQGDVSAEATRKAPAAFYQFRLSPSGVPTIPFASPDFVARYGLEVGEPEETAARFFSHIHPDDLAAIKEAIARSARTLETFVSEFRYRLPSEGEGWIEARSRPERLSDGGIKWNGIATDITARKATEAALRESEARYRKLFAANPQPMWVFDTETLAFLEVNDAAVSRYGYLREEFLSMTIADIRPPEDVPRLRKAVGRTGEGAIDEAGVWRHRRKDGSIVLVEITSHAVEHGGRPAELVIALDVTERTKAEEDLRESREEYRALVETSNDCVWKVDEKGRYTYVSPRSADLLGYTAAEVLGKTPRDFMPEDEGRRVSEILAGFAAEKTPFSGIVNVNLHKSGRRVVLETSGVPFFGPDGAFRGYRGTGRDITTRKADEEALRASEERFRAIFDLAPVGVAQADPATMRWLAVNPRMCAITGYSEDELLTMRISDITHPDDLNRDRELFRGVVKGDTQEYRIEKRYLRKDGSTAWVNVNMVVLRDAEGRPTRTLATIEDITERKGKEERFSRLNAQLEEALELQRQIFEGSRDAVFLSDEAGRFAVVNGAATELTGYSREELLAMAIPDLHDESDLAAYRSFHGRILDGERILSEAPIRRKDGGKVVVEFNNCLAMIGGRRLVYTTARDLTERASAAAALAASDARYRVLYENTTEGIIALDPETLRFLFHNPAVCAMFLYSPDEFLQLGLPDIHPRESLAGILAGIKLATPGGPPKVKFLPCIRKDGSTFQAEVRGSMVEIEGRRVGFAFFTDVTERLRLEEQLRQAQKMEAIGQLAGGVAHDFNNLLTVIGGNCDLLLSDSDAGDPRRGTLADIRAASERAAALTRQLLAFSRKQILEPRILDLHEAVIGIEKMLRRLIGEDVDLLTDLAAGRSWVKVDPGQLEQVVMNLVVNARDAMPHGGRLTIRTRNVDPADSAGGGEAGGEERRPRVALSISDTGSGMPPEVKAHVFEPFFTTKEVGKGTGLGLATVYGIVTQSGGEIGVESEPGRGTTFTVLLPTQPAPRMPAAREPPMARSRAGPRPSSSSRTRTPSGAS